MPKFGSHLSISGGLEKAVYQARKLEFDTVQIFSKNSNQWKAAPLTDEAILKFKTALAETKITDPLIHDSYLINLASPKSFLLEKSIEAFAQELTRASQLGIGQVVMHPGAVTGDSVENGLKRVADSFDQILATVAKDVMILIETTAGQGSCLGRTFQEIAAIRDLSKNPDRLGVCIDTCHIFAAGYDIRTRKEYEKVINDFDHIIGLTSLKAFHLNDSVKDLGSHVDRHAHLGYGKIGAEPFGFIVQDPRFSDLPMYLETPKEETEINGKTVDWDTVNLSVLRSFLPK